MKTTAQNKWTYSGSVVWWVINRIINTTKEQSGETRIKQYFFCKSLKVEQRFYANFVSCVFMVAVASISDKWYLTVQQGKYLITISKYCQTASQSYSFVFINKNSDNDYS